MTDGGTFNGQTITGIGITKAAKIYYEVETHLLTSGADYSDLYDALFQACNNLTGTAGITSGDCTQVRNAAIAVEMNLQPVAGFNTEAPLCNTGETPVNLFFDNLENGSANFGFSSSTGTIRWTYDGPAGRSFAHSGSHFLYGNDSPGAITDTSVAMTNNVSIPPGAFLHFAQAYGFEVDFDGGVVEYSTNSGASWTDAGSLFDKNGYNGTIFTGFLNPLSGRPAFVRDSHGYISSRLNLSSLAGQNVRFRWRMGLDQSGFNHGWWLDDVRIYACAKRRPGQITSS
jgi:hypothetical protein